MAFLDIYRSYLRPALLGGLSALFFAALLTGFVPAFLLTIVAPFPLFILGLREGGKALTIALQVGCLVSFLVAGWTMTGVYLAALVLPVFLLVYKSLQPMTQAAKRVTTLVLVHQLYGLLFLTGLFILFLTVIDTAALQEIGKHFFQAYNIPVKEETLKAFYHFFPGACTEVVLKLLFFNGVGAHLLLRGQGKALCPLPALESLELPFWPWILFAVAGVSAFVFSESLWGIYAGNVLLVLRMLFLLQGLGVAHAYAKTKSYGRGFLISLYFCTFVFDWLGLLIAGLGVLEPWLKLRWRLLSQKRGDH